MPARASWCSTISRPGSAGRSPANATAGRRRCRRPGAGRSASIREHGIDAIIHFAGSIVVPESVADPLGYYHNNTVKSRALIEGAVENGVRAFHLLLDRRRLRHAEANPVTRGRADSSRCRPTAARS